MKRAQLGTVIHGTLQERDLFPAFLMALKNCEPSEEHQKLIKRIEEDLSRPGYLEGEDALWDLEILGAALNEYAPPYAYFGCAEGDGADFGFWLFPSFLDEFEGLRVLDLAEVPPFAQREILVQKDSALSLYERGEDGETKLIWSIE